MRSRRGKLWHRLNFPCRALFGAPNVAIAYQAGNIKMLCHQDKQGHPDFMNNANAHISRRNFLTVSGAAAAFLTAQATPATAFAELVASEPAPQKKKYPIGLELYSVRDELARDLPNTLRTVAKMGYEVVEFYAPYFDWKIPYAKEVRTLMDDIGLRCYSTHNQHRVVHAGRHDGQGD